MSLRHAHQSLVLILLSYWYVHGRMRFSPFHWCMALLRFMDDPPTRIQANALGL